MSKNRTTNGQIRDLENRLRKTRLPEWPYGWTRINPNVTVRLNQWNSFCDKRRKIEAERNEIENKLKELKEIQKKERAYEILLMKNIEEQIRLYKAGLITPEKYLDKDYCEFVKKMENIKILILS